MEDSFNISLQEEHDERVGLNHEYLGHQNQKFSNAKKAHLMCNYQPHNREIIHLVVFVCPSVPSLISEPSDKHGFSK